MDFADKLQKFILRFLLKFKKKKCLNFKSQYKTYFVIVAFYAFFRNKSIGCNMSCLICNTALKYNKSILRNKYLLVHNQLVLN